MVGFIQITNFLGSRFWIHSKIGNMVYFSIILLFSVRGCRPGKSVQMTEAEVRGLCLKSREIFLQQPILLELEAPLKICGQ